MSAPASERTTDQPGADALPPRLTTVLSLLSRPLSSYYLIIGATGLLLAIGLVMVLSTTSASQLVAGGSPYSVFAKQLLGALVGLPVMWVLSRTPPRVFRALAYPLLLAAMAALLLVLAFGTTVAGAERWIQVGGFQIQPSEFAKFAFLLWGADLLARKEGLRQLTDWRKLLIPLLPGAAILAMLVMLGNDLGTTFLLLVILLALLWVIGTPARIFAGIIGLAIFALLLLVVVAKYGNNRLSGYLHPGAGGPTGQNMQSIQGKWAIGSGGLLGVGLGDGTQKWGWVPESSNDFIFAILGEELGLIGTLCVVFLYGGLAYAGLRVARRVTDPFMRLAAAGATAWIVTQALVNICAVVGLLPITGVPLPLISAGLSSLLATMAAIGMLLSFARREPGAQEALAAAGPGPVRRFLIFVGLDTVLAGSRRRRRDMPGPARRPARSDLPSGRGRARAGTRLAASGESRRTARLADSSAGKRAPRPAVGPARARPPGPGRPGPARSAQPERSGAGRAGAGRSGAGRSGAGRSGAGRSGAGQSGAGQPTAGRSRRQ